MNARDAVAAAEDCVECLTILGERQGGLASDSHRLGDVPLSGSMANQAVTVTGVARCSRSVQLSAKGIIEGCGSRLR